MWNGREESPSSLQVFLAHTLLLCFTLLLFFKLDHIISYSWWIIFFPLFMFHRVVSLKSFSFDWVPFHASVLTKFLIAFEVLLCFYLETAFVRKFPSVTLKFVFFPLLAFEMIILFDNFRMFKDLLPSRDISLSDDALWEALSHFWVSFSMVFFVTATVFTLRKLCGDVSSLGWWDLFIIFGIAECFAFLACIRWSNPMIPILVFQILLFMRLEGRPAAARFIPLYAVFSPIFLAQGIGVISASNLVDFFGFLLRHSRQLGWWSTDEGGQEEQAHNLRDGSSGYNTFSDPPQVVRSIHKKDLTVEIWRLRVALSQETRITESSRRNYETLKKRLQAALEKQREATESSQQNYGNPQNRLQEALDEQTKITESNQQDQEKLCTICYEQEKNTLLLPCEHIFCRTCSNEFQKCPLCRAIINDHMHVFDL